MEEVKNIGKVAGCLIVFLKEKSQSIIKKNILTCMNHINLANHLQNLIYYKDEYRLFYPRTPADSRHNITELKKGTLLLETCPIYNNV